MKGDDEMDPAETMLTMRRLTAEAWGAYLRLLEICDQRPDDPVFIQAKKDGGRSMLTTTATYLKACSLTGERPVEFWIEDPEFEKLMSDSGIEKPDRQF